MLSAPSATLSAEDISAQASEIGSINDLKFPSLQPSGASEDDHQLTPDSTSSTDGGAVATAAVVSESSDAAASSPAAAPAPSPAPAPPVKRSTKGFTPGPTNTVR